MHEGNTCSAQEAPGSQQGFVGNPDKLGLAGT